MSAQKKSMFERLRKAIADAHLVGPTWVLDSQAIGPSPIPMTTAAKIRGSWSTLPKTKKRLYCKACDKRFIVMRYSPRKFCSEQCRRNAYWRKRYGPPPRMFKCRVCLKPFKAIHPKRSICGVRCRDLFNSKPYAYWVKLDKKRAAKKQ